jgi:hypothetical protein
MSMALIQTRRYLLGKLNRFNLSKLQQNRTLYLTATASANNLVNQFTNTNILQKHKQVGECLDVREYRKYFIILCKKKTKHL